MKRKEKLLEEEKKLLNEEKQFIKKEEEIIKEGEKKLVKDEKELFLECEKKWVFLLLMMSGGFMGAFTYTIRGNVFCNAQTGNMVLMGIALGDANWLEAAYLLIPISAYFIGAIISEILPKKIKKINFLRWDTCLIGFEVLVLIALGFVPESAPFQISQIAINFICSMQYNTFRQAEGVPMATTFCTNHLRQTGVHLIKWVKKKDQKAKERFLIHIFMLGMFIAGAAVGTVLSRLILGKAIWGAAVIMMIIFIGLFRADRTKEKGMLERVPKGH